MIFTYYSVVLTVAFLFILITAYIIINNNSVDRKTKIKFLECICIVILGALFEWIGNLVAGKDNLGWLLKTAKFIEFIITPCFPLLLVYTIANRKSTKYMLIPIGVNIILQIFNLPFGFIFNVDAANLYIRGSFYFLYILVYASEGAYLFYCSAILARKYQHKTSIIIIFAILMITYGVAAQIIDRTYLTCWLAVSLSVVVFFLFYIDMITQTDALTYTLNRRCYENFLMKNDKEFGYVFFDLDDFKRINDELGHEYGDMVLRRIALIIRQCFRKNSYVYRVGGDEFVVIITKNLENISNLIDSFKNQLDKAKQQDVNLPTVSLGYSVINPKDNVGDQIKFVDELMYRYKRESKNENK